MDSDDRKITQLTQVTSLNDSDLFVVSIDVGTAPKTRAIKKSDVSTTVLPNVEGQGKNYILAVSVASNDLIVALKTLAGTDPSASDPIKIVIGGVERTITAAISITIVDGTNWFNSGGVGLGTNEIDYCLYAVWDSNSSAVAIAPARIYSGKLVSDFSATTTDEKHLYGYSGFTSTDPVAVIGRFAATLSLSGTSHLWTVPTFTNVNLVSRPIYESRELVFSPAFTGFSANPTVAVRYKVVSDLFYYDTNTTAVGTSNATTFTQTMPFKAKNTQGAVIATTHDNSANVACGVYFTAAGSNIISLYKSAGAAWTNAGTKAATFNGWIWL